MKTKSNKGMNKILLINLNFVNKLEIHEDIQIKDQRLRNRFKHPKPTLELFCFFFFPLFLSNF